jgi:hypothetical protein
VSYPNGFALTAGNLVGVVTLPVQYTVSFDLMFTSNPTAFSNILLLSSASSPRLPGIWLNLFAAHLDMLQN